MTVFYERPAFRCISFLLGLIFLTSSGFILFSLDQTLLLHRLVVALLLFVAGSDLVISSFLKKAPWLSKIGPLP